MSMMMDPHAMAEVVGVNLDEENFDDIIPFEDTPPGPSASFYDEAVADASGRAVFITSGDDKIKLYAKGIFDAGTQHAWFIPLSFLSGQELNRDFMECQKTGEKDRILCQAHDSELDRKYLFTKPSDFVLNEGYTAPIHFAKKDPKVTKQNKRTKETNEVEPIRALRVVGIKDFKETYNEADNAIESPSGNMQKMDAWAKITPTSCADCDLRKFPETSESVFEASPCQNQLMVAGVFVSEDKTKLLSQDIVIAVFKRSRVNLIADALGKHVGVMMRHADGVFPKLATQSYMLTRSSDRGNSLLLDGSSQSVAKVFKTVQEIVDVTQRAQDALNYIRTRGKYQPKIVEQRPVDEDIVP